MKNKSSNKQNKSFTTRTDDIRTEHDRGRKRTLKQLILNVTKDSNKKRFLTSS